MANKIQLRRDTAANWTTANPVLGQGEPGAEIDTGKLKIGDGVKDWKALPEIGGGGQFLQAGTDAKSRSIESKLRDEVSVKDFGAVGDGVADDTKAVQAAVSYCRTNSAILFWPEGDYLTTGSISSFHVTKHKGAGRILRGADTFTVEPVHSGTNIIYVSASGTDNNDGLSASAPIRTLAHVRAVLTNTTADQRNGTWRFKFAAGTYSDSANFPNLPFFEKPIEFIGTGTSRTPQTIFDGAAATYKLAGMYFSNRTNVYLQYLQFQNFAAGAGAKAEFNCQIELLDCNAINCNTGFSAALNSSIATTRCRAENCSVGFSVGKNSQATFTPNTDNIADSNRMIACGTGATVTRNSYAHVDYNEFEGCTGAALHIEVNSRSTALANSFKRNACALRCWTSGQLSINEPAQANVYYQGTADANTEVYEFRGGSGLVNLHGQAGTMNTSVYKFTTPTTITGTGAETQVGGKLFTAWAGWFVEPSKRIKVKVWGTVTTPADGTLTLRTKLQATALTSFALPASLTAEPFMLEAETIAVDGANQKTYSRAIFGTNGSEADIRTSALNVMDASGALTFYVDAGGVGQTNVSVTIESIEVEICG